MKCFKIFFILLFLSNCGFKLVDRKSMINFNIIEINSSGENKVNYFIKNKLKKFTNSDKSISVKINLNTKKDKLVKEKNIKNTITKYEIKISTVVEYEVLGLNKGGKFSIIESGDYNVSKRMTDSLILEKNISEILSENIASELIDKLIILINDL